MPRYYRDEGVVVRSHRLGEADRIVVMVTRGRGKVRAVAKGARKAKSRFGARLEPGGHVAVQCYEGRSLDTVTQAETIEVWPSLRLDLVRMSDAMALLEAVDQVAQEGEPCGALLTMLTGALRTLDRAPSALLVGAFYWKLLALEGVAPVLDACARCGSDGELVAFDPVEGGALCRSCRRGPALGPEALALIRAVLGGGLGPALATPAGPVTSEVTDLATRALEHHLERRLRAAHAIPR